MCMCVCVSYAFVNLFLAIITICLNTYFFLMCMSFTLNYHRLNLNFIYATLMVCFKANFLLHDNKVLPYLEMMVSYKVNHTLLSSHMSNLHGTSMQNIFSRLLATLVEKCS